MDDGKHTRLGSLASPYLHGSIHFAIAALSNRAQRVSTFFPPNTGMTDFILNSYAFANLDDITWGTKGSDIVLPSDLGNVVQDSQNRVDLEISPEVPNDIYVEALENIRTKKPLPRTRAPNEMEKDQIRRDYYANLRTNVGPIYSINETYAHIFIHSSCWHGH